jgi:ferric-dicitrate binding protein FerR (iron transport regulator)
LELQFQEVEPHAAKVEAIWAAIAQATQAPEPAEVPVRKLKPDHNAETKGFNWSHVRQIAAAILLVVGLATGYFLYKNAGRQKEYTTTFGQIKTITLPDNSTVILNANSKISFRESWEPTEKREVWLEGEAFFDVTHTKNHQKFKVHTSDNVYVEVLGTRFDVLYRIDKTRVVLSSGKVQLNIAAAQQRQAITMAPGDLVELKKEKVLLKRQRINPKHFSSWTQHILQFDGTPLAEIITLLEENYGLQVAVADSALLKRKLWGSIPSNNVELLLSAMSNSFNLTVRQTGNHVQIAERLKDN